MISGFHGLCWDRSFKAWSDATQVRIFRMNRKKKCTSAPDCQPFSAVLCLSVRQLLSLLQEPFPFAVSPILRFTVSSRQVIPPTHQCPTHTRCLLLSFVSRGSPRSNVQCPNKLMKSIIMHEKQNAVMYTNVSHKINFYTVKCSSIADTLSFQLVSLLETKAKFLMRGGESIAKDSGASFGLRDVSYLHPRLRRRRRRREFHRIIRLGHHAVG